MDDVLIVLSNWLLSPKTKRDWLAMFVVLLGLFLVYLAYFR